jgi:exonuclease III
VHIYYGSASGQKLKRRIAEIDKLAEFLSKRADKGSENYILLGDFNIVHPEHETMEALVRHGFFIPEELQRGGSNIDQSKYYDQIAFKVKPEQLQFTGKAGVFNFYASIFQNDEGETYFEYMDPEKRDFDDDGNPRDQVGKENYYRNVWRTFQISDHLPMWAELEIDFSKEYLEDLGN